MSPLISSLTTFCQLFLTLTSLSMTFSFFDLYSKNNLFSPWPLLSMTYLSMASSWHYHLFPWPLLSMTFYFLDLYSPWTFLSLTFTLCDLFCPWPLLSLMFSFLDLYFQWPILSLTSIFPDLYIPPTIFTSSNLHLREREIVSSKIQAKLTAITKSEKSMCIRIYWLQRYVSSKLKLSSIQRKVKTISLYAMFLWLS